MLCDAQPFIVRAIVAIVMLTPLRVGYRYHNIPNLPDFYEILSHHTKCFIWLVSRTSRSAADAFLELKSMINVEGVTHLGTDLKAQGFSLHHSSLANAEFW